jgi:alpha-tubulin suppressor-like RCC1 family protein
MIFGKRSSVMRSYLLVLVCASLSAIRAFAESGHLIGWGETFIPYAPPGTRFQAVATGPMGAAAISQEGRVFVWGGTAGQQAGAPGFIGPVLDTTNAVDIDIGSNFAAILHADRRVTPWGSTAARGIFTVPPEATNLVQISCGSDHMLALSSDGRVFGWGSAVDGRLPVPPGLGPVVSVAAGGRHSMVVLADGSARGWGFNQSHQSQPPYAADLLVVDAGTDHNVAIRRNGRTDISGFYNGEWRINNAQWSNVVDVAAGDRMTLGLQSDGRAIANPRSILMTNLPPLARLGRGIRPAAGITVAGEIVRLVTNSVPGLSEMDLASRRVVKIVSSGSRSSGRNRTIALYEDGRIAQRNIGGQWGPAWACEDNESPRLGWATNLTDMVDIAASECFGLALRRDGTVASWSTGALRLLPSGLSNVVAIAAREGSSLQLALRSDGTVVSWRYPTPTPIPTPTAATNVTAISVGFSAMALRSDGTILNWGDFAQRVPAGLSNVIAIATAASHFLALRSDGTVLGWGQSQSGAHRVPVGLTNVIAISTSTIGSLALRDDGTVVSWGTTQTYTPPYVRNVIAITASESGNFAVRAVEGITRARLNPDPELTFRTFRRYRYIIEHKDDLSVLEWSPTPGMTVEGNGAEQTVTDLSRPLATSRYYRLREERLDL